MTEVGIDSKQQYPLTVSFHGKIVGEFFVDVFIENSLIIELKALTNLNSYHKAQVINYLKASGQETALFINFGAPSTFPSDKKIISPKLKPFAHRAYLFSEGEQATSGAMTKKTAYAVNVRHSPLSCLIT